jgi:hypothetical protein
MSRNPDQVGAPDPELKTSPILDDTEDDVPDGQELESGVCYFNNAVYPLGTYVLSGDELLRCERRGVWVREGEMRPQARGPGR